MKSILLLPLITVLLLISSCKKVEGTGGAAVIKGSLLGKKYNGVGALIAEYPLAKHDVYIVYGTNTYFDDDIETSYDGSFEFRELQPGNYTIFLYEEDPTVASGEAVIKKSVTISDKKETIDLGVIEVTD